MMLADEELRAALTARLPDLEPDVEGELARVLTRADSVARRRRAAYVVGLVAAAVVAAGLVLGHDWRPNADRLQPLDDDSPGQTRTLTPFRGVYDDPAPLEPGRYRVHVLAPANH